jgi:digeranylgeranylglycerophospholipid reductase
MKCDVLVIGGGPAGLGASITASQKGLKTILVEKSTEIGYPVKTSAITWKDVLDTWKLPDKVMYQWYDSFFLYSLHSRKKIEAKFKKKIFGTLNYHTFLQELAFKASKNGTKIFLSEKVTEPL